MTSLKGLGTALITPFLPNGEVDFDALGNLSDKQISEGADYLVVLGTTAETATLTASEKQAVRQCIIEHTRHRLPLVLGIGGNNTHAVIDEIRNTDLTAFSAILSVCPYYNKPSQEGLFQHFRAIADASPIPIILYNVPSRTGVNLLPETVLRIYEACPTKIIGIKEASGNVEQIKRLIDLAHHKFLIISGDDGIAAELMQSGADGLISVASNAFPKVFHEIVHNTHRQASQLQTTYAELVHLLFVEGNPSGIKTVLSQQGYIHNCLRLPLVSNSANIQQAIAQELENLKAQ
ncbi:MAG: 4-hydroxy-tetrahydrodipicolinate synthase [Paludibacter sp.]|nr:4-hydroxy-tetrahydrodipicolinate synthase [Bacteroidales bacterium]MCM1069442.1 4-hydroxy-tetrahydrodipicolinate synthase [Prevotella sp.]MCM1353816.1 4-hydroxy-tetrahydrodipicolinate synthase [Bacteroides sp.]MCM1442783.1 4-hydroxy-tetrahydrodipicolinate synthase [Muribaculum sp.]MCM1481851.1 4-hydroxy-tetrahydrodipicolinate synthase [Paludibacter sp.]